MSDSVSSSTDSKSVKDRLTFNWPVKSCSNSLRSDSNKLPVKQRVVFPSNRLNGNPVNNNSKRPQTNKDDDEWASMANTFCNPSSIPWNIGTETTGNNKGKKRRKDWDKRNNKVKGQSNGHNNTMDWTNCNNKQINGSDRKGGQRDSATDWTNWETSSSWDTLKPEKRDDQTQSDKTVSKSDQQFRKFIATATKWTQTELNISRSIAVQTDPKPSVLGHQETAYNHYADILTLSPSKHIDNGNGILVIDLEPKPGPSHQSPFSTSITEVVLRPSQSVIRDPRIAKRVQSFQSIRPQYSGRF